MHVCPELMNLPNKILRTALSIFAVSSTMTGDFPPSSRMHGVRFLAASMATNLPVVVEPVKHIMSNFSFVIALAT